MHGIHFHKGRQFQLLEIGVGPVLENTAVRDLCFVNLSWFEFHFTLQINVSCGQDPHVEIGVNATHRQLQFRMVRNDLVRRLSLLDQRTDDPVFLVKILSGHADTGAGLLKAFPIFAVSKPGIYCKHEKTREYWKGVLIFIVIGIAHILDQNIIIGLEAVLTLRACSIIFYISTEGTHVLTNMNALGVPFPKIIKDILDRLNDE